MSVARINASRAVWSTAIPRAPGRVDPWWIPAVAMRWAFALYVASLVAAPVLAVFWRAIADGPGPFWDAVTDPGAVDAMALSLGCGVVASLVNAVAGTAIAWWLVRWNIPGRGVLAALVDLPLAIPTLVAGLVLVALYGPQAPVGKALGSVGIGIAYARPGIVLALLFVTLPFVVRAVEPVLMELDPAEEEAAYTLGASRFTVLRRILLPPLFPAVAAGAVQTFGRSVAEFGSIAAVSGNIPHHTLTAPVYVLGEVEAGSPGSAAAVSAVLLTFSIALQPLAWWLAHRSKGGARG